MLVCLCCILYCIIFPITYHTAICLCTCMCIIVLAHRAHRCSWQYSNCCSCVVSIIYHSSVSTLLPICDRCFVADYNVNAVWLTLLLFKIGFCLWTESILKKEFACASLLCAAELVTIFSCYFRCPGVYSRSQQTRYTKRNSTTGRKTGASWLDTCWHDIGLHTTNGRSTAQFRSERTRRSP